VRNKEVIDWQNAPGNLKISRTGSTIRHTSNKSIHAWPM